MKDADCMYHLYFQVQDNFQESMPMSTYLVAMVVCDYARIQERTSNGILLSIYAPNHLIPQAQFALNVTTRLLEYFQGFFGVPYPLPKQGLHSFSVQFHSNER